jgi:ATP phosphoribosyltransferase-like protein
VLRLVLPKGSLERATLELFEAADLGVRRGSDVDYRGTIDDPRITEVRILRPQEIPGYVADGLFDLGVTGRDWIDETASQVVSLGELHYSKATARQTILVSYTELIANREAHDDPVKRHAMHQLHTLLQGTLEARGRVLVKLNVAKADLDRVIALLPSLKSPTVSELFGPEGGYAVESVVPKSDINVLIPALKDHGATGILELPIAKIVH